MKARCFFGMIPCLVLFVVFLAHASAASIPSTIDIISDPASSNLTSTNRQAQSDASVRNGGIWSWYCTKVQRWSLPELEPDDCLGVLDYFYFETMEDGGRKLKEFRAPGSKKTTYTETEWTPRKYTFGRVYLPPIFSSSIYVFSNRFNQTPGSIFRRRKILPCSM